MLVWTGTQQAIWGSPLIGQNGLPDHSLSGIDIQFLVTMIALHVVGKIRSLIMVWRRNIVDIYYCDKINSSWGDKITMFSKQMSVVGEGILMELILATFYLFKRFGISLNIHTTTWKCIT